MIKGIGEVFGITNKYIVIATPLILFSLISTVYMGISANSGKTLVLLFAFFLSLLMTGAFIAGWFRMIKDAVVYPQREDVNSLFKFFPEGVGEYFVQSVLSLVNIFTIVILGLIAVSIIGYKFIGNPNLSVEALNKALENPETLKLFLNSLSAEQLNKIGLWNILLLCGTAISYFLMSLYIPALFFKTDNAYKALWVSLKDLFGKNFLKTLLIFIVIFVLYFVLSILSALCTNNVILSFLTTLLNFYFVSFSAVGVFYYYYHEFIEPKIGKNIDMRV